MAINMEMWKKWIIYFLRKNKILVIYSDEIRIKP